MVIRGKDLKAKAATTVVTLVLATLITAVLHLAVSRTGIEMWGLGHILILSAGFALIAGKLIGESAGGASRALLFIAVSLLLWVALSTAVEVAYRCLPERGALLLCKYSEAEGRGESSSEGSDSGNEMTTRQTGEAEPSRDQAVLALQLLAQGQGTQSQAGADLERGDGQSPDRTGSQEPGGDRRPPIRAVYLLLLPVAMLIAGLIVWPSAPAADEQVFSVPLDAVSLAPGAFAALPLRISGITSQQVHAPGFISQAAPGGKQLIFLPSDKKALSRIPEGTFTVRGVLKLDTVDLRGLDLSLDRIAAPEARNDGVQSASGGSGDSPESGSSRARNASSDGNRKVYVVRVQEIIW